MIPNHEYIFTYMTNKSSLTFDGTNVLIKQGPFRKFNFAFNSIQNWYVYDDNQYRSMFITWMNDAGKQKKIQLFTQHGEQGFHALIDGLNQAIPQKCLNHLDKKEAFKIMKAADPKKVGALGAMIVIFVLSTIFMYPGLCHYFDFGYDDEVYVEDIVAGDYESRNVTLYGYPLQETLEETYTKGSTTTITYFVPIVGESWEDGDPIEVILKFSEDDYYNADEESLEFTGVIRNIWYEGIDSDEAEFFETEYGFEVSDDVVMVEATGEERNGLMEFIIWCVINGIFVLIFGIVYIRSK